MIESAVYGISYVEHLSYLGFFFAVGFSGYVLPIPEEIILVLAGYLAAQGAVSLPIVILVSVLGAICGDTFIYYLSGHGSRFTKKYHHHVEKTHVGWYMRHMKKNPASTIFFSRFLIGMRFFNPLVSGLLHTPARVFVSSSGASAALYIPLVVLLGYYFEGEINSVIRVAESVRFGIISLIIIGTALLIILFFKNLWEKARGA